MVNMKQAVVVVHRFHRHDAAWEFNHSDTVSTPSNTSTSTIKELAGGQTNNVSSQD